MIVHDYAGNSKAYTVKVPGNSDDYGIVKPTNVLWTETFDNDWLPADWSMESKGASVNTWYRDVDYTATVDADDDFQQNEWLYSRATDISGVETDVHMIFNFYTTLSIPWTTSAATCRSWLLPTVRPGRRSGTCRRMPEPLPLGCHAGQGHHPRKVPELRRPALRLCLHR